VAHTFCRVALRQSSDRIPPCQTNLRAKADMLADRSAPDFVDLQTSLQSCPSDCERSCNKRVTVDSSVSPLTFGRNFATHVDNRFCWLRISATGGRQLQLTDDGTSPFHRQEKVRPEDGHTPNILNHKMIEAHPKLSIRLSTTQ
jgi:hypothetical protein